MNFFPEASRFNQLDDMEFAFGNMGLQDKANIWQPLFRRFSDYIVENIDADFGFSRYAERLGKVPILLMNYILNYPEQKLLLMNLL
jgi:hypothetical protein